MNTINMTCRVEVDLSEIPNDALAKEVHLRDEIIDDLKEHFREEIEEGVTLEKFRTEEITDELRRRKVEGIGDVIRRIYSAIADGRQQDALDDMHVVFSEEGLAPPSSEMRRADLLSGRKVSSNVHN
ncbi:hypothetical protein [Rhizobium leucaenae]|uniref:hypothetical protein n=1 Tax=Rhizobium leucaenae TaxID=29450 RepID=UPI0007EE7C15|nr:hypothetical protein [Rhizobium leucaenae]